MFASQWCASLRQSYVLLVLLVQLRCCQRTAPTFACMYIHQCTPVNLGGNSNVMQHEIENCRASVNLDGSSCFMSHEIYIFSCQQFLFMDMLPYLACSANIRCDFLRIYKISCTLLALCCCLSFLLFEHRHVHHESQEEHDQRFLEDGCTQSGNVLCFAKSSQRWHTYEVGADPTDGFHFQNFQAKGISFMGAADWDLCVGCEAHICLVKILTSGFVYTQNSKGQNLFFGFQSFQKQYFGFGY